MQMITIFRNGMWNFYTTIFPYRKYKPFTVMMFKHFKNRQNLVGCEIGVSRGINARSMLYGLNRNNISMKKMYLIDPFIKYEDTIFDWGITKLDTQCYKKYSKKFLSKYSDIVRWVYEYSHKAVEFIDEKLDFCYIDGNHQYEYVKKDIELFFPLMKQGGMFGGDDYAVNYSGVRRAVDEFVEKHGFELYGYRDDWAVKI